MPNGKPIATDLEVLEGFEEEFLIDGVPRDERLAEKWGCHIGSVYAIWNKFDFKSHCNKMRALHPDWSSRQIECCLYWQGTARKHLKSNIKLFLKEYPQLIVVNCPEAQGVDITATMASIGIYLEWSPVDFTYQVVLAGHPNT